MYKSVIPIALLAALIISSCGEKKADEKEKKEEKTEESVHIKAPIQKNVIPNMLAEISISGMVCEINCVGSVKKLLSAMIGVTEIEIDFSSNDKLNHAKIIFDDSQISDKQMVNAIEKLNDGAYKVEKIDVKKLNEKTACKKKKEEKDLSNVYHSTSGSSDFALPSILDVFSTIL